MNLTISFANSDVVLAVDVDPSMRVNDFKAYILNESGFPNDGVILFYRDERLGGSKTLESYGIQEDDMILASHIEGAGERAAQSAVDSQQVEQMRKAILYNPDLFSEFSDKMPELAQNIHDPQKFREAMESTQSAELAKVLNPDSEEGQMRILEEINQAHVQSNLMQAMEEIPEAFAPVTMLYAPLYVNGHLVKALVDSGAQSTVMSPECAERCGIMHLLDKRMKGVAVGVGKATSIGRIHMAPIKVGSSFFPCSFTVLEGLPTDLLFGLDMLKHHQATIHFGQNKLLLGDEEVEFLPESEIPQFAHPEAIPLKVTAPPPAKQSLMPPENRVRRSSNPFTRSQEALSTSGLQSGSSSGPAAGLSPGPFPGPLSPHPTGFGSGSAAGPPSAPPPSSVNARPNPSSGPPSGPPSDRPPPFSSLLPSNPPSDTQSTFAAGPPTGPPPSGGFPESEIAKLTNLGFNRNEAINAMRQANGNVEMAGAILFGG
ncbi:DNA damage-inducible protein 1 [Wickerhamiella sorbophila]|uniref:DNA damage-inducible protein 1 n=1 Tax=Wickerhamiella sorbophila TaxID=45607 RepID=A0A2T0FBK9_9ASCO|nr:DNA damage-inducible protein 1 [Wickerhamiella sorbophila]PRT52392.1 DNA damage-inducible protein 1 [Wickerhamiella sorbophila]